MTKDDAIKLLFEKFISKAVEIIGELSAEKMISESAINPILAKSLGFDSFDTLARFYVYQRISRSLVTSFGTYIENLVKIVSDGKKGVWWDVVSEGKSVNYYLSVKSGPRDMNKDQTVEFSRRAKKILKKDPKGVPVIAMGYGKEAWPVIIDTLRSQGLDPKKHAFVGKHLYSLLTGEKNYHEKIMNLVLAAESEIIGKKSIVDLMDDKVKEITSDFKKKYKTVDDLLMDTF
jgi:hypothetical protein